MCTVYSPTALPRTGDQRTHIISDARTISMKRSVDRPQLMFCTDNWYTNYRGLHLNK